MKFFGPLWGRKYKWSLLAFDVLVVALVASLVNHFRLGVDADFLFTQPQLWFVVGMIVVSQYIFGGYDFDYGIARPVILFRQLAAMLLTIVSVVLVNYLFSIDRAGLFGRGILLGSIMFFSFFSVFYRIGIFSFFDSIKNRFRWLILIDDKDREYFEGDRKRLGFAGNIHFFNPTNGDLKELELQLAQGWSTIVVGVRASQVSREIQSLLMQTKFSGRSVMDLCRFYEKHWLKVPVYFLDPEWFIVSEGFETIHHPVALRVKRLFDLLFSVILFVVALPLMALTAVLVKLSSPGPIIYRQIRTGKDGRPFAIFKFRSMRIDAEKDGIRWAQENDTRSTVLGRFIRVTHLDELPQLWNILRGEMSFVGPRPERPEFNEILASKIPFYNLRHLMRPGLTGWAQVLYPYGASVEDSREKLQYELYYAKYCNLMMDFLIFVKTIRVVLFGRGR